MEEKKKGGFIKGVLVGIVLTVAVAAAAGGSPYTSHLQESLTQLANSFTANDILCAKCHVN